MIFNMKKIITFVCILVITIILSSCAEKNVDTVVEINGFLSKQVELNNKYIESTDEEKRNFICLVYSKKASHSNFFRILSKNDDEYKVSNVRLASSRVVRYNEKDVSFDELIEGDVIICYTYHDVINTTNPELLCAEKLYYIEKNIDTSKINISDCF